jgi:hypothetical protein
MQVLLSLVPHHLRVLLYGGLGTVPSVQGLPLLVDGLTVDSKLTVVVPLRLQIVVLLLLVALVVLHPNHSAEGGDRDEFNVLLLDFPVEFPGGRTGGGEAA